MITTEQFHGLHHRFGFTQAEDGAAELFNDELVRALTKLTKQAILHAEHHKHAGLNGAHATAAIEMTKEIPSGLYA